MKKGPDTRYAWLRISVLVFTFLFLSSYNITLANERSQVTAYAEIPVIQSIEVSSFSFSPEISIRDLKVGYIQKNNVVTLTISSNMPWVVSIRTNDVNLSKSGRYHKPISDFLWRKPNGIFMPISNEFVQVESGNTYGKDYQIELDYRLLLDWTRDRPGRWGVNLEYMTSPLDPLFAICETIPASASKGTNTFSSTTVRFPEVTSRDLNAGFVDMSRSIGFDDVSVFVESRENGKWRLYIKAEVPVLFSNNFSKPCHDLLWKLDYEPEAAYRPLSVENALVVSGINGNSKTININFRLKTAWADSPGSYSMEVLFWLVSEPRRERPYISVY